MRFIPYSLCAFAAIALPAPALAASSDYFLKLGGVSGEAAARGHKDWIEIQSWSWGATNTRKGWDGTITGRASSSKYGAVAGAHRDDSVAPPPSGGVRVKVKFPWLDCKPGAAFPNAVLQNAAGRYELKEVIVASCPVAAPGGGEPAETLTLNYAKVIVRGWDPEKKE
jgi:hypothetical protein